MAELRAEYYTDPLCAWSWSNEPHRRKLRAEFGNQIAWRHRMGGLVESWSGDFYDPTYDIRGGEPDAVAKHQEEVSLENRMPIDVRFWHEHPYPSTFPLCVAVKAVGLQSATLEDRYLRRLREALLTEARDLRSAEALVELAAEVPGMDLERLRDDIESDAAKAAFREDWAAARNPVPEARDTKETEGHRRYGFPTLILLNRAGERRVLDGDHPYAAYVEAIRELAPTVVRKPAPSVEEFVRAHRSVATKEVAVVCEVSWEDAAAALTALADAGIVRRRQAGHFAMWDAIQDGNR